MIKNILFDMGDVLIRWDPAYFIRYEGVTDPADAAALEREIFRGVNWVRLDRGSITEDELLAAAKARLPERLHAVAEEVVRHWDKHHLTVPGMEALAEEVAGLGYTLCLLTNTGPRHHEYWPGFPVSRLFPDERIFRSADWQLLKPEHEFYETALKTLGIKAEECVFIDDNVSNAEAAGRCGIDTVLFRGAADLRREFRERGVMVREE